MESMGQDNLIQAGPNGETIEIQDDAMFQRNKNLAVKNDENKVELPIPKADVSLLGALFDDANAIDEEDDEIQEVTEKQASASKEKASNELAPLPTPIVKE